MALKKPDPAMEPDQVFHFPDPHLFIFQPSPIQTPFCLAIHGFKLLSKPEIQSYPQSSFPLPTLTRSAIKETGVP